MVVDIFITIIIIITAMLPIILMIIVTAGIWEGGPWNVQVWKEFTKKMRSIEFSPNLKWSMFSFRGETRTLLVPPEMGYGERGVPNVSFVCVFTTYLCCEGVSMFFYSLLFILTKHLWCEGDFCVCVCFFQNICGVSGDSGWSNSPFHRWASLNQWWTASSWDKGVITREIWCFSLVVTINSRR